MKDKEKVIKDILKNFDFKKVHNYMESANWTWWRRDGDSYVPSISELVSSAEEYLRGVTERDDICAYGSGGLEARKTIYEGKITSLKLDFILEESYWEDMEEEE